MGIKQKFLDKLNSLEPEKRRKVIMIGSVTALIAVMSVIVLIQDDSSSSKKTKKMIEQESVGNVLMGTQGREIGLSGVSNDVQVLKAEMAAMKEAETKRLAEEERLKKGGGSPGDADSALESLSAQVGKERDQIGPPGTIFNPDRPAGGSRDVIERIAPTQQLPPARPIMPSNLPPPAPLAPPVINTSKDEAPRMSKVAARLSHVYIPTGSMMSGVLLTGLDAPTGRQAQSTPIPVVIRVKHEAILPSQYSSDVREAFILAAGFGDLSSERAYVRAERFSMILRNGEVIDLPIKMSAVGNDGKSGLRGRVVSKQGAVIGQALLAGVADGVSRAFGGRTSSFGGNDLPSNSDMVVSGVGGGATGALDRIAAYFLEQAEAMYPVVEIDGGREVTMVLLEGLELTPRVPEEEKGRGTTSKADSAATSSPKAAK